MNTRSHDMETKELSTAEAPKTFDSFNLDELVSGAIRKLGFEKPTPVQYQTYQEVMNGRDIIAMAQTGTGKTAAFGIPIAQMLTAGKGVQALILAPTRELALQVCRHLDEIGAKKGIRSVAVYGGASFTKQVEDVQAGASVVVGTPGRLLDHIKRGTIKFGGLKALVLDEADEMLSMGFEKEISAIIESLPTKRQTLLFSATIPDDIQRLAKRYMCDPVVISVSGDEIGAKEVSHFVYLVSGQGRQADLVRVIEVEKPDSAIIFCNTRDETQTVAGYLNKRGYNSAWINSDLSQNEREKVMSRIRNDQIDFLVATDVAARGIDVSHLSHVINYTFPESLEIYIHRTGRTGRMGREGAAISLIAPQDLGNLYYLRLTYKIFPLERTLPDDTGSQKGWEQEQIDSILSRCDGGPDEKLGQLARRIMQHVHSEKIVGFLLGEVLGKSLETSASIRNKSSDREGRVDTAEAKVAKKNEEADKPPASVRESVEDRPQREESRKESVSLVEKKVAPAMEFEAETKINQSTSDDETNEPEVFVDAGRKDGLRISGLMKQIVQLTGLPRSAIGKVRMLTRSTFISVPDTHFQRVLDAAKQIEVGGRKLKAEPAKES